MKMTTDHTDFHNRHEVYDALLNELSLSRDHQNALLKRKFKIAEIHNNSYRSLPPATNGDRNRVVEKLAERFGNVMLSRVPGFLTVGGEPALGGMEGLLIPVRDVEQKIVALKIRSDHPAASKYLYLSSAKHGGPSSGSHVHVPLHRCAHERVRVTEGELKADFTTVRSGTVSISIPGVQAWSMALPTLNRLAAKEVLVAFDSDFRTNPAVAAAMVTFIGHLRLKGFDVGAEVWNPELGKGVDDALAADAQLKVLRGQELDELIRQIDAQPQPQPQPQTKRAAATENEKPIRTYVDAARSFLLERGLFDAAGNLLLRSWRDGYYEYREGAFRPKSANDLEADVMALHQKDEDLHEFACTAFVRNTVANLRALTRVESNLNPPCFLDASSPELHTRLIPLVNGILELASKGSEFTETLMPPTPRFFCLNALPFPYEPEAKCPSWLKFLNEMQPDQAIRDFLQEWLGYCLVPDTSHDTMVFNLGEGANGKSVFTLVATQLLGEDNVSHVPLEAFSATKTALLGQTFGKLGNFVDEMDQIDRAPEGLLKTFISGGQIVVDRKYNTPLTFKPYARIMMATNVLPRLTDRSGGLWRRIIVVPWEVNILDPKKQNRRFRDPEFWRESGEMSGILNWAIEGLKRLTKRGSFDIPERCRAQVDEYRSSSNPAKVFLNDRMHEDLVGEISVVRLREEYDTYCREHGHRSPLGPTQLVQEVRRVFPKATQSKNALTVRDSNTDGYESGVPTRSRVWKGFRLKRDNE